MRWLWRPAEGGCVRWFCLADKFDTKDLQTDQKNHYTTQDAELMGDVSMNAVYLPLQQTDAKIATLSVVGECRHRM